MKFTGDYPASGTIKLMANEEKLVTLAERDQALTKLRAMAIGPAADPKAVENHLQVIEDFDRQNQSEEAKIILKAVEDRIGFYSWLPRPRTLKELPRVVQVLMTRIEGLKTAYAGDQLPQRVTQNGNTTLIQDGIFCFRVIRSAPGVRCRTGLHVTLMMPQKDGEWRDLFEFDAHWLPALTRVTSKSIELHPLKEIPCP